MAQQCQFTLRNTARRSSWYKAELQNHEAGNVFVSVDMMFEFDLDNNTRRWKALMEVDLFPSQIPKINITKISPEESRHIKYAGLVRNRYFSPEATSNSVLCHHKHQSMYTVQVSGWMAFPDIVSNGDYHCSSQLLLVHKFKTKMHSIFYSVASMLNSLTVQFLLFRASRANQKNSEVQR